MAVCLIKCHTIKAYVEWKDNSTHLLPWDKMEVSSEFHVPATLPHGKSPHCPFSRRLDGPLSQSRWFKERSVACGGNEIVFSGSCCTYPSHYTDSPPLASTCVVNDVTILVLLTDPVHVVAYDTELSGSRTGCFRSRWELVIF